MIDLFWFIQYLGYVVCFIWEGHTGQVIKKQIEECKTGNGYDMSIEFQTFTYLFHVLELNDRPVAKINPSGFPHHPSN